MRILLGDNIIVVFIVSVVFFFNDTATTEIYTYVHTLSLHDALPSSAKLAEEIIRVTPPSVSKVFFACSGSEANDSAIKMIWYYNNAVGRRSEEHTSELQSLMRISYAGFCLKKKNLHSDVL